MKKTVATYKQTLFDIALQNDGTAQSAITTALRNNLSLSDDIEPGQEIELNDTPAVRPMVKYYQVNALQPATAIDESITVNGGINYMGIEIDFIVS